MVTDFRNHHDRRQRAGGDIHDRMPVILAPSDYARWLGEETNPRDLMRPFPAELMRMWPISTRVNKPENDDPSIIEPIEPATDAA
jgi:putative SOS response-associated peptidase YedK